MHVLLNEMGILVTSQDPFIIQWGSQEHKLAFYDRFFTERDWEVYDIVYAFCTGFSLTNDFSLVKGFLSIEYKKDIHEQMMNLIEESSPELYKQLRLPLVTGSFVISNKTYEPAFKNLVRQFLEVEQKKLHEKVEKAIDDYIKPLYQATRIKLNG